MHPDNIGPYLIKKKIGAGGMGNVYLGNHEETGQEVAVKVLPASMAREEGFVLRFSREVESLRKLHHDNIVDLYDDGQAKDGSYYFSMEFVDGETLTSLVSRRKRIPWLEVIEISLQIAAALKAAHNAGIVHRDLKPSNLMVRKDGQIKLTDFGVAHVFATTRLTRTGGVVGTAEYMSPEQARGKRATKESDLYSLGAVMYVMLTGRPPFTGKMASDILHQHQYAQFDKPTNYVPEIPRLLEDFVCRLLEKKPENRFPDALVAIRQLTNVRSRIEFEQNADAETLHGSGDPSSDHTMGGTRDQTQAGTNPSDLLAQRPGAATLVRDILRKDLESQSTKTPVQKFMDNTFVLLALFAGVIGLGYYLLTRTEQHSEQDYQAAVRIMETEASEKWIRARGVLLELRDQEEFTDRQDQIDALINKAEQYRFTRDLTWRVRTDGEEMSEVQRQIRVASTEFAKGNVNGARQQVRRIRALIGERPEYEYLATWLDEKHESWGDGIEVEAPKALLRSTLAAANELLTRDKTNESAIAMLTSALEIYGDDETLADELQQCRELLNSTNN